MSKPKAKQQFKVVGRYVYPWLESTQTFTNYEDALKELKRWKKDARDSGHEIMARIVDLETQKKAKP